MAVREASPARLDPANEGELVHLSATLQSATGSRDPDLGVPVPGAVLRRQVQMFQWAETPAKDDGPPAYELGWHADRIDSRAFQQPRGHINPQPALPSATLIAADARLGPYAFDLPLLVEAAAREKEAHQRDGLGDWASFLGQLPPLSAAQGLAGWRQTAVDEYQHRQSQVSAAGLGDLSVTYLWIPPDQPVSVIAMQHQGALRGWPLAEEDGLLLARAGTHNAAQMLQAAIWERSGPQVILLLTGLLGTVVALLAFNDLADRPRRRARQVAMAGATATIALVAGWYLGGAWASALLIGMLWGQLRSGLGTGAHRTPAAQPRHLTVHQNPLAERPNGTAAAPPPRILRQTVGRKSRYRVDRLLRVGADGQPQLICFELARDHQIIVRGERNAVRQALIAALEDDARTLQHQHSRELYSES